MIRWLLTLSVAIWWQLSFTHIYFAFPISKQVAVTLEAFPHIAKYSMLLYLIMQPSLHRLYDKSHLYKIFLAINIRTD